MVINPIPKWCLRLHSPCPVFETRPDNDQNSGREGSSEEGRTDFALDVLRCYDQSAYLKQLRTSLPDSTTYEWIRHTSAYKLWVERNDHVHLLRLLQDSDQEDHEQDDDSGIPKSTGLLLLVSRQRRLWISGSSDSARTLVILFIIDELQRLISHSDTIAQVLYFFCDRRYTYRNSAAAMVKTWIYQLIQQRPDLTAAICAILAEPINRFIELEDVTTLWNAFRSALIGENAGTTYCVISGLYELDERGKKTILELSQRQLPLEGCSGNGSPLKILIADRERCESDNFGKISLDRGPGSGQAVDPGDCEATTTNAPLNYATDVRWIACREIHENVVAYRQPPTIEQLKWVLFDNVHRRIQSSPFLFVDDWKRVQFRSSEAWHISSGSSNTPAIHLKFARISLEIIERELGKVDMETLEEAYSTWYPKIDENLMYAVCWWAEHVKLSLDSSNELVEKILTTFTRNSSIIEKWWIVYLQVHYHISQEDAIRNHHTIVLHLLALFNLHELLQKARVSSHWYRLERYLGTTDSLKRDPLGLAILQGSMETTKFLVTEGAEIKPVHTLYAAGLDLRLAQYIFSRYRSATPLMRVDMVVMLERSVASGSEKLVSHTIKFLRTNCSEKTLPWKEVGPLRYAIETGQRRLIKPLLEITQLGDAAEELIDYSAECHEELILGDLMQMQEIRDIIVAREILLIDALNFALEHKCPFMVGQLMSNINVGATDIDDETPLQAWAKNASVHTLCRFFDYPKFRFDYGRVEEGVALNALLHKAIVEVDLVYLEVILQRGARMRYDHFGITALHVAAEIGRTEVIEVLLKWLSENEIKADIDRQCTSCHGLQQEDKTALAIAAAKGHNEIVKLLLANGARLDLKDKNGKTAMDLASEAGHQEVVKLLRGDVQQAEGDDQKEEKKKRRKRGKKK